jgi:hypothetical protein
MKVLDKVYANCIDQISARLFYAVAAAENMLVFGSDVCNAFAEAQPPKQGFFIQPNRAFHKWWANHKGNPPIPPVTLFLSYLQCRATLNPHASGNNMLIAYFVNLVSNGLPTNPASTWA